MMRKVTVKHQDTMFVAATSCKLIWTKHYASVSAKNFTETKFSQNTKSELHFHAE